MANQPALHSVEKWLMRSQDLNKLVAHPGDLKETTLKVLAQLLAKMHVVKPITPARFLADCEDYLNRTYGHQRFQYTLDVLQKYHARGTDIDTPGLVARNLNTLKVHGHVGYLNAIRRRFYAEMHEQLRKELRRSEMHGTVFRESPHPRLIKEVAHKLRVTPRR